MADELQTGIYGSNWWNSSRNLMGSPPCSGGFGWTTDMVDMNSRSNCDESSSAEDSCIVFQDIQKPQQHDCLSGGSGGGGGGGGGGVMMDSTMQMMGFNLSSSASSDWTQQTLLGANGKVESNYNSMLQDDLSSRLNYSQESEMEIQKDWSSKDFSGSVESMFKPIHQGFSLDQPTNFPMTSSAYTSTLLQSLFEPDPEPVMNYQSMGNYHTNSNQDQLLPWPKKSPYLKPKQLPGNHLQFSNNTPFWNASAVAQNDIRTGFISSSQVLAPTFEEKPNRASLTATPNMEEVREPRAGVKKTSSEPAFKRVRMETPSPLPTFKVRKEKLGDRITALQQLVSPFGKTDTASVLHEAIEYIKFLHDQVSVLSTPYMKNGLQHQLPSSDNLEESEDGKQDLRSRGLCLVPVSITYPVAHESTSDFWTPTFGGSYR